jgi:hypothetical protein
MSSSRAARAARRAAGVPCLPPPAVHTADDEEPLDEADGSHIEYVYDGADSDAEEAPPAPSIGRLASLNALRARVRAHHGYMAAPDLLEIVAQLADAQREAADTGDEAVIDAVDGVLQTVTATQLNTALRVHARGLQPVLATLARLSPGLRTLAHNAATLRTSLLGPYLAFLRPWRAVSAATESVPPTAPAAAPDVVAVQAARWDAKRWADARAVRAARAAEVVRAQGMGRPCAALIAAAAHRVRQRFLAGVVARWRAAGPRPPVPVALLVGSRWQVVRARDARDARLQGPLAAQFNPGQRGYLADQLARAGFACGRTGQDVPRVLAVLGTRVRAHVDANEGAFGLAPDGVAVSLDVQQKALRVAGAAALVVEVASPQAVWYGVLDVMGAPQAPGTVALGLGALGVAGALCGDPEGVTVSLVALPAPRHFALTGVPAGMSPDAVAAAVASNTTTHVFQSGQRLLWLGPCALLVRADPNPCGRPGLGAADVEFTCDLGDPGPPAQDDAPAAGAGCPDFGPSCALCEAPTSGDATVVCAACLAVMHAPCLHGAWAGAAGTLPCPVCTSAPFEPL